MSSITGASEAIAPAARPRLASRLALLDGIRGYLLVAMYSAHFCIEMNDLGLFTWLSYARHSRRLPIGDIEFFLPMSGFVVALSYYGIHARLGQTGLWQTVGRRWRWIYFYQVTVAIALLLMVAAGLPGVDLGETGTDSTLVLIGRSLTLSALPKYVDILVLNLVLLPFVPPAFAALARGRAWQLAAAVALAWIVAGLGLDQRLSAAVVAAGFDWHRWFGVMGHFNPLSYALLFFAGFWLGYRFKNEPGLFTTGPLHPRTGVALVAGAVIAAYLLANFNAGWRAYLGHDNSQVAVHAIIITTAVYYLLFWLLGAPGLPRPAAVASRGVRAVLSWPPLTFLGSNSLFVYACHVLVVALAQATIIAIMSAGIVPGQAIMFGVASTGLVIIYAITRLKIRYLPWMA